MSILIEVADFTTDFSVIEQIRIAVFQVEQSIKAEDEFDGKDAESIHLLAYFAGEPVGTIRIREVNNEVIKIERLAVLKDFRAQGIGKKLMDRAIATVKSKKIYKLIKIHAQAYLENFYTNLGFTARGENFIEAGIEHVLMTKQV
jgi:predicted GNAT family N-acyltransferase